MNGFLPTRGTLMLDFVFVAMFAIVPLLAVSVACVKRRLYFQHVVLQIGMALVLLAAVLAFEADMRFGYGWKPYAEPSPYFTQGEWGAVWISLIIHLCFAIPTPFLWAFVIVQALRKFPYPWAPGEYSHRHKKAAWAAVIGMTMTAITGWVFYWLAFVST